MEKQRKYPEYFVDGSRFKTYEWIESNGTYNDDYRKAKRRAKQIGGQVYTAIDHPGTKVAHLKGFHFVNRIGYVVVKY